MSGPEQRRDQTGLPSRGRPAAERELDETLLEDGIGAVEKARRLFTHGLLREQEELNRPEARARYEARIQAILHRLAEPAAALEDLPLGTLSSQEGQDRAPAPIQVSVWKKRHFRFVVSAVAALLLAFVTLFWLGGDRQTALPELLALARENHSRGLHVYRGFVETRRGAQMFDLALAEGGKVQIHIPTERGDFDVGSSGKIGWFKTPIGKAVEVPLWDLLPLLEALPESFKALSPDLSYLEVEGLLAKILTEDGMRITGREKVGGKDEFVLLEGRYRVLGRGPHAYGHRRGRHRTAHQANANVGSDARRVYTGSVKIRISPEKGWIHDIRFKDDQRKTETLLERVLSLPDEGKADRPDWIQFEPEFTKSVPSLRLLRFMSTFLRKWKVSQSTKARQNSAVGREPKALETAQGTTTEKAGKPRKD